MAKNTMGHFPMQFFYERHYFKENIDTLIVFPYGPGVFCELGDLATAKYICEKMLVVIDSPFEGQANYINDGVVKAAKTYHATIHYVDYNDFEAVKKVCNDFVELRASFARLDVLYAR
ncbi:hypothetical protein [Neorhizobium galegae]|nr:hypothetical protein [Neorhizobium galegae]